MEPAAVDKPGDNLMSIKCLAGICRNQPVQLFGRVQRLVDSLSTALARSRSQRDDDRPANIERLPIVLCQMIADPRQTGMYVSATQFLGCDLLTGCRFDERRPGQINRAGPLHDDILIAHGRHIGAAGRAHAHDYGDLWDTQSRHPCLVVKNPPEVLLVRKDLGLHWEEYPPESTR